MEDNPAEFFCTILGGPNGSGKSTAYELIKPPGPFVNADVVASEIRATTNPQFTDAIAGRMVVKRLETLLNNNEDFVFETTLSSQHSLSVMQKALERGYEVGLIFVALNSPDLNVERVANRVARGGHDIPEDVIRRRYEKSLNNLAEAIRIAHVSHIFDNSGIEQAHVAHIELKSVRFTALVRDNGLHSRIAQSIGDALSLDPDILFDPDTFRPK